MGTCMLMRPTKFWGLGTSIFCLEAQRIVNVKLIFVLSIDHDKEISYPILSGP